MAATVKCAEFDRCTPDTLKAFIQYFSFTTKVIFILWVDDYYSGHYILFEIVVYVKVHM